MRNIECEIDTHCVVAIGFHSVHDGSNGFLSVVGRKVKKHQNTIR
jgi:hypothetical protein